MWKFGSLFRICEHVLTNARKGTMLETRITNRLPAWTVEESCFDIWQVPEIFLIFKPSGPFLKLNRPPIHWAEKAPSLRIKTTVSVADINFHTTPSLNTPVCLYGGYRGKKYFWCIKLPEYECWLQSELQVIRFVEFSGIFSSFFSGSWRKMVRREFFIYMSRTSL